MRSWRRRRFEPLILFISFLSLIFFLDLFLMLKENSLLSDFKSKIKELFAYLCLYNGPDIAQIGFRVVMVLLSSKLGEEEKNEWLIECGGEFFEPPVSVRDMFPQKVFIFFALLLDFFPYFFFFFFFFFDRIFLL